MSRYSGKCDLADLVFGQGGYFDKEGNPVKFGDRDVNAYYSNEWLDFLAFKKKTNGTLYQHKNVKVHDYNQEEIKKYCSNFDYREVITKIEDKRSKKGYREERSFIYTYYGKEYTEKELNAKGGVYLTLAIKFDTLLDLLEYYPYLTSAVASTEDKLTVVISERSFVEAEFDSLLKSGYVSNLRNFYKKELAKHYAEVALQYYNPKGHEVEEIVEFNSDGIGLTKNKINDRFNLSLDMDYMKEVYNKHSIWTNPKLVEENKIKISLTDLNELSSFGFPLKLKVKYVEDFEVVKTLC